MDLGKHDHPFYRPLWRRIAIVLVTGAAAALEVFYTRDGFWSVIFVAIFAYCIWAFLISYKPSE
jgi:hypothetical protein